jgi:hypothetical protein
MRRLFSQRLMFLSYAALVSGAFGIVVLSRAIGDPMANPERRHSAERAADLVDQLSNSNKPPRIVERHSFPVFPASYDWSEDKRVFKALQVLWEDRSDELWEEVIRREAAWDQQEKRTGDSRSRYCLTIQERKDGSPRILSVREVCAQWKWHRLLRLVGQHLPPEPGRGTMKVLLKLSVDTVPQEEDWAKWRREGKIKTLYKLQIEVCEKYLRVLAKEARIPDEEKAISRKKVEEEIAKLRRTKKPIIPNYELDKDYSLYTPQKAKEIREKLKLER